jgi:hypothetical protein
VLVLSAVLCLAPICASAAEPAPALDERLGALERRVTALERQDAAPFPADDRAGYAELTRDALRGVVRSALKHADKEGGATPSTTALYLVFRTDGPGVVVPADLVRAYPDQMAIILQYEYRDLRVEDTRFSVTLRFDGEPRRLSVPYSAITRFCDRNAGFSIDFEGPQPLSGRGGCD